MWGTGNGGFQGFLVADLQVNLTEGRFLAHGSGLLYIALSVIFDDAVIGAPEV